MHFELFIAHTRRKPDDRGWLAPHELSEHLAGVSALAACFARDFGEDWARLAGLWHDLGKYRPGFQFYIREKSGFERENAHIEGTGSRVEHSAAGAVHAIDKLGEIHGRLLAYLIAGHHAGLPDWNGDPSSLYQRLDRANKDGHLREVIEANPPSHILDADGLKPTSRPKGSRPSAGGRRGGGGQWPPAWGGMRRRRMPRSLTTSMWPSANGGLDNSASTISAGRSAG